MPIPDDRRSRTPPLASIPLWQRWLIVLFGSALLIALVLLASALALLLLPVALIAAWLWRRRMRRLVEEAEARRQGPRRDDGRTIEGDYRTLD